MDRVVDLMAYQRANKQALHTLYNWQTDGAEDLLPKAEKLESLMEPVLATADQCNFDCDSLRAHLGCLLKFLRAGQKDRCLTDIRDIVHKDMPALADHLLSLAGTDMG